VYDRLRREPEPAPRPAHRRSSALRVGAVDDPAERAADRLADAAVDRLMSARSDDRWAAAETRIRRSMATQVIRRVPYLTDAVTRRYGDSKDKTLDLAYLGKVKGIAGDVFVDYDSVDAVNAVIEAIAAGEPTGGPVRTRHAASKGRDRPYDLNRRKSLSRKRDGFGTEMGNDFQLIQGEVSGQLRSLAAPAQLTAKRKRDQEAELNQRARQLKRALGTVRVWIGADAYADITSELDGAKTAAVIMTIAQTGPTTMAGGAGSRLPEAVGTLYVSPKNLPRRRIFQILGVEEADEGEFVNVKVSGLEPEDYASTRDQLLAGGSNMQRLESAAAGHWMFYASEVPVGITANRRITIAGQNWDAAMLGALDPVRDAHTIKAMHTSFASLDVRTTDWIPGTELQASLARESGQNEAMAKWSALGAAAYANRFLGARLDLGQNWEWLHVRGAQIGGDTVNGNLVPGLFTTNSAMIPFEAMIKNWAIDDPLRFAAKFTVVGQRGVFVDKIVITIKGIDVGGRGHKTLGTEERELLEFDPLQGRVIDRMGGVFVKRAVDFAEVY
jgi:hypothetical protein